jgi:hypothetical protein
MNPAASIGERARTFPVSGSSRAIAFGTSDANHSLVYPRVLDEMLPAALHRTDIHAYHRLETDHGCLKARLRPTRAR